jgi:hypothetical protein
MAGPAEIYNLRFNMSPSILHVFYAAVDFVLANSKHEPFGLVGLEAMAAGGVVLTGPTGETYSSDGEGAVALDTEQAGELVLTVRSLSGLSEKAQAIRQAAPYVAARYTWENVVEILFEKINLAAYHQNIVPLPNTWPDLMKPVQSPVTPALARPPRRASWPGWPLPVKQIPLTLPEGAGLLSGI